MPSMSYCAFENTVSELEQILQILQEQHSLTSLLESRSSSDERVAVEELADLAWDIVNRLEELDNNDN